MEFPARGFQIALDLYKLNPELTTGDGDQQRLFIKLVAEQCAFEFGPQYGNKRTAPDHPQGPTTIAYTGDPAGLGGWRIIDGDASVRGSANDPNDPDAKK